jgi:hypothetical protein
MGSRLYSSVLGRFLQVDPVPGGGVNAYAYPPDPINANDYSGAVFTSDSFDRSKRATWDGGGHADVQASMRAMAQTNKNRESRIAWRQTSAALGAISTITGILSFLPGPIGWVAYGISVVTAAAVAAIDCSEKLVSETCGVDIATAVVGAIAKPLGLYLGKHEHIVFEAVINGVGLTASATSLSYSAYGYRESRFNP